MNIKNMKNFNILKIFLVLVSSISIFFINNEDVYAKNTSEIIVPTVYEFDEDTNYVFSGNDNLSNKSAYGQLMINGQMTSPSEIDGVKSLCFSGDSQNGEYLSISYKYNDDLLNASEENWHLIEDKSKKIDAYTLDEKILKGAIMLQTSKDGKVWIEDYADTNIFVNNPNGMDDFYKTTSVQLTNGCYYRVIVVYEICRLVDPKKILFVNVDQEEIMRYAEVYEFYAYDRESNRSNQSENTKKYKLGKVEKTAKFEGYAGTKDITPDDPHYEWDLGKFYISGYTDTDNTKSEVNNIVFLKAVGDRVTLGFNLNYDINRIKGNEGLTIIADESNTDQYFRTKRMNFGRGALIVRKINEENDSDDPVVYTNFLLANASVGADTKIDLFEEGDYEVALDYKLQNVKREIFGTAVLPEEGNYRIFFNFSVRNANCMVYPFDVKTGGELTNSSMTENGFYLDLAKSKYLKVVVKKEVLKDGFDGLSEDTRFNSSAKAGDKFTDEGIYTITVTNPYTKQTTVKRICVGSNNILKAHMVTGLSIADIQDRIANGATVDNNGVIIDPEPEILECICEKKCSLDRINGKCEACLADYSACIGEEEVIDDSEKTEEVEATITEENNEDITTEKDEVELSSEEVDEPKEENTDSDVIDTSEEIIREEIIEENSSLPIVPFIIVMVVIVGCVFLIYLNKNRKQSGEGNTK